MTEQTQPTDAELIAFATDEQFLLFCDPDEFTDIARAVLAKWGTPAGAGDPYGYVYTAQVAPIVGDERKVERTVFTRNKPPCNALALFTTPQPTQAQAGAVPLTDAERWAPPKYDAQQREWCVAYEAETGFDPMMDDYEAGLQTFAEAAVSSLRWYEDHTSDAHLRISSKTIPGSRYDIARTQHEDKA